MDIPGYTIIDKIGSGGMATVYKGIQDSLQRKVAIKVIHRQLTNQVLALEQFEQESFIIAQLNHPHVIHIIDRGLLEDQTPYFIMEYLDGQDLSKKIEYEPLTINQKIDILIQVCKALGYAHKNGVIHRDIKPANIFIDRENYAHVLDFGIAQFCDSHPKSSSNNHALMGTLAYMSPEQYTSPSEVTQLSDIYALGVVMYLLFTGQKPNDSPPDNPSTLNSQLDPELSQLILDCLSIEPKDRPTSADKVKDTLLKLLRGTHLKKEQREQAERGISSLKKRFSLLDVIREEKHSGIYLYENNQTHDLLVIKKRPIWSKGFNETNLLKPLSHTHIAKIYGTSKNNRTYIIVMEYLSGGALQDRLIVAIPWHEALIIIRQICLGLAYAHQNNIIHGNLRPSNILFDDNGLIKLTDFGLDEHYQEGTQRNWYKLQSEEKTKRTDIFSVGVILYQLLTGSLPKWKNKQIDPNEKFSQLPDPLKEMIDKMVHWSPISRHSDMNQLLSDIDSLLTYHEKLEQEAAKTQLWEEQRAIEQSRMAARKAQQRKILRWGAAITGLLMVVLGGIFFQDIQLLFG